MPKSNQEKKRAVTGVFGTFLIGHTSAGLPETQAHTWMKGIGSAGDHLCVSVDSLRGRGLARTGVENQDTKRSCLKMPIKTEDALR